MNYFAYGSNMLTERLIKRIGSVNLVGVASIEGRKLAFHKRSEDGSGKCDIPVSKAKGAIVRGVVYEVTEDDLVTLDEFEGVGKGYERVTMEVQMESGPVEAATYVATDSHIEKGLLPYDWYHGLVLAGAMQHGFPKDYIASLAMVEFQPDPDPNRITRKEALAILESIDG